MSYRGKKIAEALRGHQQSEAALGIDKVFNALSQGPLRALHFDTFRRYAESCLKSAPIVIQGNFTDSADSQPTQRLESRLQTLYIAYMGVQADDPGIYAPLIQKIVISQKQIMSFHRRLPLQLLAAHLEFRHVERSTQPLKYEEDPFKLAASFSLLLSDVLASQIPEALDAEVPIVIPQPRGMFLGVAKRVHPKSFMPISSAIASYDEKRAKKYECIYTMPDLFPNIQITAKTYIHMRDFFGGQRMLYQQLAPFFEDEGRRSILARFVDCYTLGSEVFLKGHEKPLLAQVKGELDEITRGSAWLTEMHRARRSVIREDRPDVVN